MAKRRSPLVGTIQAEKAVAAQEINTLDAGQIQDLWVEKIDKFIVSPQAPPARIPQTAEQALKIFVGREADIEALITMLRLDAPPENPIDIVAVHGMPGVGKSALAIMLAHHPAVKDSLPDGVLWASLGSEPDVMTRQAAWAGELGDDLSGCTTPDTRRRRLLSLLNAKKALLILDDVWQVDEAKYLLVGGPACRTLVTTRNREVALALAERQIYNLKPLTQEASMELLQELAPEAIQSNLKEGRFLAKMMSGLPLALKLAGLSLEIESLAGLDVTSTLAEMQDREARLELAPPEHSLGISREEVSLRAIFGISYTRLPDDNARRAFRELGVYDSWPATFNLEAARAIWQLDPVQSKKVLLILANRALIEPVGAGRFALHAVLADYASSLLLRTSKDEALSARRRFATHYLETAKRYRKEEMHNWQQLDLEWENIRAAANWVSTRVLEENFEEIDLSLAADYAVPLDFVIRSRKIPGAEKWLKAGVEACRRLERVEDQGWLTLTLGITHEDLGELETAAGDYRESAALFTRIGQQIGLAYTQGNMGTLERVRGEYLPALKAYQEVLKFCESQGDDIGSAIAHYNLGDVYFALGERPIALEHLEKSIRLCRQAAELKDKLALGLSLSAEIYLKDGQVELAQAGVREASEIANSIGSGHLLGIAARAQAEIYAQYEQNREAEAAFTESLRLLEEAGVSEERAQTAEIAGHYMAGVGKLEVARQYYLIALNIYQRIGAQARAKQVHEAINHLANLGVRHV